MYISKLRPMDRQIPFYAASSGDSYKSYANLMFDVLFIKIDEIINKVNEIIDYLNECKRDE